MGCTSSAPVKDATPPESTDGADVEGENGKKDPQRRLTLAGPDEKNMRDVLRGKVTKGNSSKETAANPDDDDDDEGTERESKGLPLVWGEYSRPGNDHTGAQKTNQDSFVVKDGIGGQPNQFFAAVCDGHGPQGHKASQFCVEKLPGNLQIPQLKSDPFVALTQACVGTNQELSISAVDVYVSGSTGIMFFLRDNKMYIANVGDSRAVLGRENRQGILQAVDLSSDQKPDRPDEMARIQQNGGRVFEWGVPRVWLKDVDMPGLAMSRSFGDLAAESVGVHAEPELSEIELRENDKFVIIGSDGIFEFMSSEEVVNFVGDYLEGDPQDACEALVAETTKRWNEEEDVVDDTTCIIVYLFYGEDGKAKSVRSSIKGSER